MKIVLSLGLLISLVLTTHLASSQFYFKLPFGKESGTDLKTPFQDRQKTLQDSIDQYSKAFNGFSKNFPSGPGQPGMDVVGASDPKSSSPTAFPFHIFGPAGWRSTTPGEFPFRIWGPAGRTTQKIPEPTEPLGPLPTLSPQTPSVPTTQDLLEQPSPPEDSLERSAISNPTEQLSEPGNEQAAPEQPKQEPDEPAGGLGVPEISLAVAPEQREEPTEQSQDISVESVTSEIISLSVELASEDVETVMSDPVIRNLSDAEKLAHLMPVLSNITLDTLEEDATTGYDKREAPSPTVALPEAVDESIDDAILTAVTGRQKIPANANVAVFQQLITDIISSQFQSSVKRLNETRQEAANALTDFVSTANETKAAQTATETVNPSLEELVTFQMKLATLVTKKKEYKLEKDQLKNEVVVRFGNISSSYSNSTDAVATLVEVASAIQDPSASTLPTWIQAYYGSAKGSSANGLRLSLQASGSSGSDGGSGGSTVAVVVVLSCMVVAVAFGLVGVVAIRQRRRHRLYTKIPSTHTVHFTKTEKSEKNTLL